jgi:hypothetical protein
MDRYASIPNQGDCPKILNVRDESLKEEREKKHLQRKSTHQKATCVA